MKNKKFNPKKPATSAPEANARTRIIAGLFATLIALSGCSFAPAYKTPMTDTPTAYKEMSGDTSIWKTAEPHDSVLRDNWWELFNDAELNGYEVEVNVSNQNIALAAANYRAAHALVAEARSQYFPTISAGPSITRTRGSKNMGAGTGGKTTSDYTLPVEASWEPDLWGRVGNTVKANSLEAQASAGDLENARLSVRAELASDYFQLRALDSQKKLLDDTVAAYQKSMELTNTRFQTGIVSDEDVAQAEAQLDTARAQATDVGVMRAQLEHAIALLLGQPASNFSITAAPLKTQPPVVPMGTPSQLLERRPDIAAAERRVAEANARIGVGRAAYFPNLMLGASGGLESTALSSLISAPSLFWSLGASATQTLFDAGLAGATVNQYKAQYDAAVATYRQTVLSAFASVEDNLAALRIYAQEQKEQDAAVASSQRLLTLANQRYQLGIDNYLNVITAQTTLLGNQRTALNLQTNQLVASVQLIKALGGGWNLGGNNSSSGSKK